MAAFSLKRHRAKASQKSRAARSGGQKMTGSEPINLLLKKKKLDLMWQDVQN